MDYRKMDKTITAMLFSIGLILMVPGLASAQAVEKKSCESNDVAAQMVADLVTDGLAPEAALAQALSTYQCAVEAAVTAALTGATDEQVEKVMPAALALAGPKGEDEVISGALIAGVDPTPYIEAAAAGPAGPFGGGGGSLPGNTGGGGGGGGGGVSPS